MKTLQDPAPKGRLGAYQDANAARLLALREPDIVQLISHL
jgi:hypothetical protein